MSDPSSKVISLADRRAKKEKRALEEPIIGKIIWLYCSKCKSLEYSEVQLPSGRIHKICGTLVKEKEVKVDIRTEYTISLKNSMLLDKVFEEKNLPNFFLKTVFKKGRGMLESFQAAEVEYRKRLENMINKPVKPYPDDWDAKSVGMRLKIIDPLGLVLTEARQPNLHFPEVDS